MNGVVHDNVQGEYTMKVKLKFKQLSHRSERDMFYQIQNGKVFARDFYHWIKIKNNTKALGYLLQSGWLPPKIPDGFNVDYN